MTIPFSQVKPASLKMRVLPRYPASYRAGPGIAIAQSAGVVTTSVDFANLIRDDITDPTTLYVAGWDNATQLFKLVLGSNLKGAQGIQGTPGPANSSDYETRALAAAATIAAPINYLRIAGYAAAGDGGVSLYKRVASVPAGQFGFQSADGAWWQLSETRPNVKMFGAKGDGATNDASAFNTALAAFDVVFVPAGRYKTSSTILLNRPSNYLVGDGQTSVTLECTNPSAPVITIGATPTYWGVKGMTLLHSGATPVAGGDGIQALNLTNNAFLYDLIVQQNYEGLYIGPCLYGLIQNVTSQFNQNSGFHITNSAAIGGMQWQLTTTISSQNGNNGYFVESNNSASGAGTLGAWTNVAAFANNNYGMIFLGTSTTPVANIRVNGAFLGQDGKSEIYLDTHDTANTHIFSNMLLELAGTYLTGPTNSVAASGIGDGMTITAANGSVSVSDSWIHAMSYSGINSSAKNLTVTNCNILNNGGAAAAGNRFGIVVQSGGSLLATGNQIYNTAGTSQEYGVYLNSGSFRNLIGNNNLIGNAGAGNSTSNFVDGSGAATNIVSGNIGYNPRGAVAITVGASPFTYTAGASQENVFIIGGTITGLNVGGVGVAGATNSIVLGPNQSLSVAYSAAPTMVTNRQ